jgi:hypothetical protein
MPEVELQLAAAVVAGRHGPWVALEVEPAPLEGEVAAQLVPWAEGVEVHIDALVAEAVEAAADHATFGAVVQSTNHPHLMSPLPAAEVLGELTEA